MIFGKIIYHWIRLCKRRPSVSPIFTIPISNELKRCEKWVNSRFTIHLGAHADAPIKLVKTLFGE